MKLSRVIAALLFGIYVMSSCGAMLSVILCHCERSAHYAAHHCCDHCHSCSAEAGEGIKAQTGCDCHHDHSTEIDLYNHEETFLPTLAPAVCAILPTLLQVEPVLTTGQTIKHLDRRKIPLPQSDFVSTKALRAPPVIA